MPCNSRCVMGTLAIAAVWDKPSQKPPPPPPNFRATAGAVTAKISSKSDHAIASRPQPARARRNSMPHTAIIARDIEEG